MNMHKSLVAVLGLILISSTASAATCRAGSAAQAGSIPAVLSVTNQKNQHKPPPVPQP